MLNYSASRKGILFATAFLASSAIAMPPFGDWSEPADLASLPGSGGGLSTPAVDGCASLSPDGLSVAFTSNRTGNFDIYVASRASKADGFGSPVRLPEPINTSSNEPCPTLAQGNQLFFSSDRDDPAYDLYVSHRAGDSWSAPVRLGPTQPAWLARGKRGDLRDGGQEAMIFSSRRPDGSEGKIYESVNGGPASLVAGGPHSSASDNRPSVTHDGKTIFFNSNRYGTLGGQDLYYSTPIQYIGGVRARNPSRRFELTGVRCASLHQLGWHVADIRVGADGEPLAGTGHMVRDPREGDGPLMIKRCSTGTQYSARVPDGWPRMGLASSRSPSKSSGAVASGTVERWRLVAFALVARVLGFGVAAVQEREPRKRGCY